MKNASITSILAVVFPLLFFMVCPSSFAENNSPEKNPANKNSIANLELFGKSALSDQERFLGWKNDAKEADIKSVGGDAVVTGLLKERNFAAIHKIVTFDLDRYPEIEIAVKASSASWYFIASGEQIKNGYVKLQPDVKKSGTFKFNLKKIMGLSGKVTVDFQVGVSVPDGKRCDGETVTIGSLVLIADPDAIPKTEADETVKEPPIKEAVAPAANNAPVKKSANKNGIPNLELFGKNNQDINDWYLSWGEEAKEVEIKVRNGDAVVTGLRKDRNFARTHKNVVYDIDLYPEVEITVTGSSATWYFIASGAQIKDGYVKLKPDTKNTGTYRFNLKKLTGLSGEVTFDFQVGVSSSRPGCDGETVAFSSLLLVADPDAVQKADSNILKGPLSKPIDLLVENKNSDISAWFTRWQGQKEEVTYTMDKGNMVLEGKLKDLNFSAIHRHMTINIEEYPVLAVETVSATKCWYLIISGPLFKDGYVKIQPDTDHTGRYFYNLKNLGKLSGTVSFDLQLGVSDPKGKSSDGLKVIFKQLRFPGGMKTTPGYTVPEYKAINNVPAKKKIEDLEKIPSPSENISFSSFFPSQPAIEQQSSKPEFSEKENTLVIANNSYELCLNRNNGAILYIKDKKMSGPIFTSSLGGALWKLNYTNKLQLSSRLFSLSSKENIFSYLWDKERGQLILSYKAVKNGTTVVVNIIPSDRAGFDFQSKIANGNDIPILMFTMPQTLGFDISSMERFFFPWKMGLYFKKDFYLAKRYVSEPYPFLFADFVSLESKNGRCSIYMIQKKDNFQQAMLNTGYNVMSEGQGMFEHESAVYIPHGVVWESPILRFRLSGTLMQDVKNYASENGLDKTASLRTKLGESIFKKLSEGVLLKIDFNWVNMPFKSVSEFVKTLPASTIVHMVAFWPKGFDQNYPDYIPPNPKFGTTEEMKEFINTAHKNGYLVMPYTNPTWWNDSETLTRLGANNIAVKKIDGTIYGESYWEGKNKGVVISPYHPDTINRINQTASQFADEMKFDMIFEDQLGARGWIYDFNKVSAKPAGYIQGVINIAKRDSVKLPVMTEGGFDMLMPYMAGFCDMSVNKALPPDPVYDGWWGKGNWEIYPAMLTFARSKTAIYQHNLAHEVFTDGIEKLTWDLAYGHNLYNAWWPGEWENRKKWFIIADYYQKNVVARTFGKDISDFRILEPGVTVTKIDDMIILANHNMDKTFEQAGFILAKGGFLAASDNSDFVSGYFSGYNNKPLTGDCFVSEKRTPLSIALFQLEAHNTFISVKRPSDWILSQGIHGYAGATEVPVAVNSDSIIFFYDKNGSQDGYKINYVKPAESKMLVRISTEKQEVCPGDEIKVKVSVGNSGQADVSDARLVFSVLVFSKTTKEFSEDEGTIATNLVGQISAGQQADQEYSIKIPATAGSGSVVWLKAGVSFKKDRVFSVVTARNALYTIKPVDIHFAKAELKMKPGEKYSEPISVMNVSSYPISGKLTMNFSGIPQGILHNLDETITLKPQAEQKVQFSADVPSTPLEKKGKLSFLLAANNTIYTSAVIPVSISPDFKRVEMFPKIFMAGKEQPLQIRLRTSHDASFTGTMKLVFPSGWKTSKTSTNISINRGECRTFTFSVKPDKQSENKIQIFLNNVKSDRALQVIKENETGLIESDVNGDGLSEIVIGNGLIESVIAPVLGGRILSMYDRSSGHDQLFNDYPGVDIAPSNKAEDWAEYGGINDCLPVSWPGDIWNKAWDYMIISREKNKIDVIMKSKTQNGLEIQRQTTLDPNSTVLHNFYNIQNSTKEKKKFTYASHPDFAPGPEEDALPGDLIIVPVKSGITKKEFRTIKQKNTYAPDQGWCVSQDPVSGEYMGQIFDLGFIKEIGVWEGGTFYTMELTSKEMTLEPETGCKFFIDYFTGKNDWEKKIKTMKEISK